MAVVRFEWYDEEGEEVTYSLPARMEVCTRCDGEGSHVNPAIDGNGITSEEMRELGDEFLEDYLGGRYDVRCEECKGKNVIACVNEDIADPIVLAKWFDYLSDKWESEAIDRSEARAFGYY